MADKNLYKFVGVSCNKGAYAVRYANDANRSRVLERNGHTNILFIELDEPSRVEDCVDTLLGAPEFAEDIAVWAAVTEEAERLGFVLE